MNAKDAKQRRWSADCDSPEATAALARDLAPLLHGGEIILLRGELGTGKTLFASALIEALGHEGPVTSPTYVLLCDYPIERGPTVYHFDFYRLEGDEDLETMEPEEFAREDSVVIVEWPERCPGAFGDFTLQIEFKVAGQTERRIEIFVGGLEFDSRDWPERESPTGASER